MAVFVAFQPKNVTPLQKPLSGSFCEKNASFLDEMFVNCKNLINFVY